MNQPVRVSVSQRYHTKEEIDWRVERETIAIALRACSLYVASVELPLLFVPDTLHTLLETIRMDPGILISKSIVDRLYHIWKLHDPFQSSWPDREPDFNQSLQFACIAP